MSTENNDKITIIVSNIRRMLIEQFLNFDKNDPNKSMAAALTGQFENTEEITRRSNIVIDLKDEIAHHVSESDYYLCKNWLTKFIRSTTNNPNDKREERMGYVYMLV